MEKLKINISNNLPATKEELAEVKEKINEIVDVLNKASNKPVGEQTIESWFKTNEERINDILLNNPVPTVILGMMKNEVPELFIKACNINEIIRRCNIIIENQK